MQFTPAALQRIAAGMRAELARLPDTSSVQRLLEPYAIVLARKDGSLNLHIGHRERWVDLDESRPFAQAFGVPAEDLEPEGKIIYIDSRLAGHVRINTMRYTWREELLPLPPTVHPAQQLTFFGADPYQRGA